MTATAAVPGTPLVVVFSVDRGEFIRPLWLVGAASALLGIFALALLAVGLRRQLQVLLGPIGTLADAARTLASGDLTAEIPLEGPREVAQLARSFNAMVASLRQRTEDLMRRVRELVAVQRMNESVMRQLGRAAIAQACIEAAVDGLGFEHGRLYWAPEGRDELVFECATGSALGESDDSLDAIALGSDDPAARAVRDQRTVVEEGARTVCAAPVMAGGRVIAVMVVDQRSEAGRSALRVKSFSLLCGAAGVALENARLLEETLSSEERYRTAVENSPHVVVSLDQNLRVTLWNRRAEALFGYQPTEAFGRSLEFIFADKEFGRIKRQVETEGAVRQAEATGVTRDGRSLDLNVSWTGQASARGAREWFVVIQDETEKKRLQSQLIQAEKLSAIGTLIAGVAHELNNPLAAVMGFAEMLKDIRAGDEEREDLRLLHASAVRCRDIVQGLLSFVRQGKTLRQRIPLNYLTHATIGLLEYRLVKTEGISLDVELDRASPFVAGDFSRIQQIVVNLLTNAADAVRDLRVPRVIRVRTRVLPDGCELEVEDNGPGVAADIRARLFEPFVTTKPVGMGTGLGLNISAKAAAEFGASLRYEDVPGGGARFIARFPACPAGLQEADSSLNLPPPCPGTRVLVLDDEPELAQLMRRILSEDGMIVTAASDLDTARRSLAAGPVDLVVTDIDLGPTKGFALFDELTAGERPAFLFVTGDVLNQSLLNEAAKRRAPLLAKPFLRTDFLRAVRRAVAKARSRKA